MEKVIVSIFSKNNLITFVTATVATIFVAVLAFTTATIFVAVVTFITATTDSTFVAVVTFITATTILIVATVNIKSKIIYKIMFFLFYIFAVIALLIPYFC